MNVTEYLKTIDEVIEKGRYKDNWESLSNHKTPSWYYNGKLGIFIHWGIYSVPAFGNEWYSRAMYDKKNREFKHHLKTYGPQDKFGYKDFIPMFKAENFSAEKWVDLFKRAGAKYVMPVCEHHDGFAMYDSELNPWNAKRMGPCRDVAGELKAECEKQGLTFCASTHRAEHYFFMNPGRTCDSDVNDDNYRDFYGPAVYNEDFSHENMTNTTENTYAVGPTKEWLADWMAHTCELIDRYQPADLYFDWWIHNQAFKPYLKKIAAYYYNRAEEWGKEVTINYKHEAFPPTVATFDVERGALTGISPIPWQTDTAIGKGSWGYRKDNEYKNSRQIICDLIDIVSKNGMLLLNIGPKPDGTITDEETKVLEDLGHWMDINGEGIYGTTFWKQFGEGKVNNKEGFFQDGDEKPFTTKDFRFTYKDGCIYAFQMRPSKKVVIKTLKKHAWHDYPIESIELLGSDEDLEYDRNENALEIKVKGNIENDLPQCFKIKLS
ncbi:MAG: alpha-L-fucosidase [Clostridiales bacterium]|nr:alpha-L-fucosidase [Clostridiales bacterium]